MANFVCVGVCLFIIIWTFVPCSAIDYAVGDTSGWTLGVDYSSWTKGKTFKIGDNLVFKYGSGHTVDEVKSGDYSSCTLGNSISSDKSGSTTIGLKTAGTHYFVCGIPGHCSSGMKVAVTVGGAATASGGGTPATPKTTTSSGSNVATTASPFVASFLTSAALLSSFIIF